MEGYLDKILVELIEEKQNDNQFSVSESGSDTVRAKIVSVGRFPDGTEDPVLKAGQEILLDGNSHPIVSVIENGKTLKLYRKHHVLIII